MSGHRERIEAEREENMLLPCTCHSDDLEPYCPRHTPLPGEANDD